MHQKIQLGGSVNVAIIELDKSQEIHFTKNDLEREKERWREYEKIRCNSFNEVIC